VFLGLDIRDNGLVGVVVDDDGNVIARERRNGATPASAADLIAALPAPTASRLGAAAADPDDARAADIVAAAAGAAVVAHAPRVVTCGSAIALAEQWRGAARDCPFVAALVVGDCVQAGFVMHGELFEGSRRRAGSAAWLALNPVEREDYRRTGCLDAEIGPAGIVKRIVWRIKAGDESRVTEMAGGDLGAITVDQVFAAARSGDGVAISVARDTARYAGMAIANLAAILDPDVVVIAGVIADAADLLLEPVRTETLRRVSPAMGATLRLATSGLGDDAAALGAARAAMLAP
jgi:predicted NBD/HSP70 family sugar kinase